MLVVVRTAAPAASPSAPHNRPGPRDSPRSPGRERRAHSASRRVMIVYRNPRFQRCVVRISGKRSRRPETPSWSRGHGPPVCPAHQPPQRPSTGTNPAQDRLKRHRRPCGAPPWICEELSLPGQQQTFTNPRTLPGTTARTHYTGTQHECPSGDADELPSKPHAAGPRRPKARDRVRLSGTRSSTRSVVVAGGE